MVYLEKGYIGNFDAKTPEELKAYLLDGIKQLNGRTIIAPIDGDTWHNYRLVSWDSGFPQFPLEPNNPIWYNDIYKEVGFKALAKYYSVSFPIRNIQKIECSKDVVYKNFEPADLKTIHELSVKGFSNNFLYDEISYEEFSKLYEPLMAMLDSDFVLIAYVNNLPCGFMFAIGVGDIFILKSITVLPEYQKLKIGSTLVNKVLLKAHEKGFTTAIGALIIDDNISGNIVAKYGAKKIREYTLYEHSGTTKAQ